MKRIGMMLICFICGAASWALGSQHLPGQSPAAGYSTEMLLRTNLQNLPGQEALVFASTWAPGSRLPMHMHPNGHEFTVVTEGEQTFHFEGGAVKTVKAGEVLYTAPNVPHYGENATNKPSKTIVFRIKDISQPISVEVKN
ncbi:MAG: cupin domain-containing protein [Candidatus Eiseniibacteriota bacterium]